MYVPYFCPMCEKTSSLYYDENVLGMELDCPHCHREVAVKVVNGYVTVECEEKSWSSFLGIRCFVEIMCAGCKRNYRIDFLSQIKLCDNQTHTACRFVCGNCHFERILIIPNDRMCFSQDLSDRLAEFALNMDKKIGCSKRAWRKYVNGKAAYLLRAISRGEKIMETGKDLPCKNLADEADIGTQVFGRKGRSPISDQELKNFRAKLGPEDKSFPARFVDEL